MEDKKAFCFNDYPDRSYCSNNLFYIVQCEKFLGY